MLIKCIVCEKKFKIPHCRQRTAKYCSATCKYSHEKAQFKIYINCANCKNVITRPPRGIKRVKNNFCSLSCSGKFYSKQRRFTGADNPAWKGGVTPLHILIRTSSQYKEWRVKVFTRDDYTCQFCKQYGGRLEADHIKPFSKYPELVFELNNGRTLCKECHEKTPTYGFKAVLYAD